MGLKSYPRLYFELVFVGFTVVMSMSLISSFLPILAEELDPSGVLVGLTVSAFFLARLFIEIPAGIISDRIGRRKLLITGVGLNALAAVICSQATNIYFLILGRALWGLGTALFFMNNAALIIDLFDNKARGQALGVFNGIEFLGSFIGAPVGAVFAGVVSYRNVFYFALALILSALALALTSRSFRAFRTKQVMGSNPSIIWMLKSLRNWNILIICAISLFRMLIMQGIFATVFQLYLNDKLLFPVEHIGLIMGLRTAGHIVATVSSGSLSDRFGRRTIILVGFLIDAGCLTAFTSIFSLEMFITVGFLGGFGEGLVFTSLIIILSEIAHPSVRGCALGLYRTFMDLGGFAGPMIFMLIYTTMSPTTPFLAAVGINIMNIALLAFAQMKPSAQELEANMAAKP